MTQLDFGSLNETLAKNCAAENLDRSADGEYRDWIKHEPEGGNPLQLAPGAGEIRDLMSSAGPISDAYIMAHDLVMLLNGPGGSGKTTASVKKALVEAQRIYPGADGTRRYVLGVWRQKYTNLWKATIPSWWSVLPKDLPHSRWVGAPPRDAWHQVYFEDAFGPCVCIAHFRAFGDTADPEDIPGTQHTAVYPNEMATLPEELLMMLADRIGRDPPPAVIRRTGRIFGDCNAPDVQSWVYRDFWENTRDGYVLYRQPGGREAGAENLDAMGRGYYLNSARINAHRPWWVRVMVDNQPGFLRSSRPVYPKYDDNRNLSTAPLEVFKHIPVLVGIDGGYTPSAVYMQELADGQLRILAECPLERGGMKELATAMLALEARRFDGCEFVTRCDPAMLAGEETDDLGHVLAPEDSQISHGSDRQRLAEYLGRDVDPARTQEVARRIAAVNDKFDLQLDGGRPGMLLDPSCRILRRGFAQTFHFRTIQGTDDVGSIAKTFDGHTHEALQYGALECGTSIARLLTSKRKAADRRRLEEARNAPRFNPLKRYRR